MYKQGYKKDIMLSAQGRKMTNQIKAATVPNDESCFLLNKSLHLLLSAFIKQNSFLIENLT